MKKNCRTRKGDINLHPACKGLASKSCVNFIASPDEDPAVRGNGVETLLDGTKSGSVTLVMGFHAAGAVSVKGHATRY